MMENLNALMAFALFNYLSIPQEVIIVHNGVLILFGTVRSTTYGFQAACLNIPNILRLVRVFLRVSRIEVDKERGEGTERGKGKV